ncbi:FtsX-like permease family protein [Kitasatospora sp. NPDC048365]|uniref:FtsX-like permease family protein n=1 Tax=Kitasatospora sp. NPDC048365 TaxID=3364050 RepID=UPI0037211893
MLSIALATVRTRWVSFVGAFIALALGTGMIAMMALTLTATIGTPHEGPQRFGGAQTVVVPADPRGDPMELPAALPAELAAKAAAAGATVEDRTFDAAWKGGPSDAVGHGWSAAALTPYALTAGQAPADDHQVVLAGAGADQIGKQVLIATPAGPAPYTVSGVTARTWFESPVFFTDAEAARLSPGINALAVHASADAVRRALGDGPLVLSGGDRRLADPDPSGGADALINAQSMAATTGGIAVSVAVFIVIATFAFVVEQRSRELALLRLVGATPQQVRRMVIAEAALIGLAAAVVGCVLGPIGAGRLNSWMIDNNVAPDWFHIGLNPIPLVIAFLMGVGSALLGAVAVALRASRVRPVTALRESAASTKVMTPVRWVLGVGLLVAAVATGWSIAGDSPTYAVNPRKYGMVPLLYVGGLALLAPVLLRPVARIATWPLSRFGAGPLIVRQNTLNGRRRTAATVTPIVVAVGLTAAMVCMQAAGDHTKIDQVRQQTRADYVVLPQGGKTLDRSAVSALENLPGAKATVIGSAHIYIGTEDGRVVDSLNGQAVAPTALGSGGVLDPRVVEGSTDNLGEDFIVVDQKTAKGNDLTVGQTLTVWLPDNTSTKLRIAAVIQTGLAGDDTYLSASRASGALPTRAWLTLQPGTTADSVAAALKKQAVRAAPVQVYYDTLKAKQKEQTKTAATVILGISVGYSLISVANTLVMAAAGRRRELAALNLAGATRAQTLRVIAAEALLATVIGTILAAVAGAAVIATQRLSLTKLISDVPTVVPWGSTWQAVALCAVTAVVAAVLSAWNTTRGRAIEIAGTRE